MKRFSVTLWEETISFYTIEVDAEDRSEAVDNAWNNLDREKHFDYSDVGNGEVNDVTELLEPLE